MCLLASCCVQVNFCRCSFESCLAGFIWIAVLSFPALRCFSLLCSNPSTESQFLLNLITPESLVMLSLCDTRATADVPPLYLTGDHSTAQQPPPQMDLHQPCQSVLMAFSISSKAHHTVWHKLFLIKLHWASLPPSIPYLSALYNPYHY